MAFLRSTGLSLLGLAAAVVLASAGTVQADTKSKPRNTETMAPQATEVSRRAFSQFRFAQCGGSASCNIDFGTVKPNRLREITFVSCYVVLTNAEARPLYWRVLGNGENSRAQIELLPVRMGTSGGSVTYNATQPAFIVVDAGATITASLTRDGSAPGDVPYMQCTVSGYESKLAP